MTNTTEAALRDALQNPQLDAALLRILQGGQGLGDAEKFAFRALRDCIATLATVGQDGGPFHVSRSSDGEKEWFSARDAAAGVSIPAKCRDDAYALVASLNRSCVTYAALSQPSPASSTVGEAEQTAWAWLERRSAEHPNDVTAYGTDDMIDAFMAGAATYQRVLATFANDLEMADFANVGSALNERMCCNGHMCGCRGATVGEYLAHELRSLSPSSGEPASVAEQGNVNLSHEAAIKALCDCAATVTVLSYQEVIEGYFSLRGLPIPGGVA